jgi:hypothetical protein
MDEPDVLKKMQVAIFTASKVPSELGGRENSHLHFFKTIP